MAHTIMSTTTPDGSTVEYRVSGPTKEVVEAGIEEVRKRNDGMAVSFRRPFSDGRGGVQAVGWVEDYQRMMP